MESDSEIADLKKDVLRLENAIKTQSDIILQLVERTGETFAKQAFTLDDLMKRWGYSIRDAINEGYLSKILVQTIPLKISLKGVKTTAGDYSADDLGSAIDPYLEEIAKHIPRDRKTLIFLPLIATSERMAQILKSLGHKAEHISGVSSERKEILERFHSGEITVLCNSMLLTEGYDEPSVDCVVCLRPTKIRSLYAQIIGRGTRICDGKENLLVLDFLWQSEQHSLCHPASLIANKTDVAEQMTKIAESGAVFDLNELEQEAECTAREEREKSLADAIKANSQKKSKLIDPMEFALFTPEIYFSSISEDTKHTPS